MASKNLNECSGCLIINNDENISLPAVGDIAAYDVELDKPCFFVNKHYISPVEKCYNVKLPNPVSLEYCDKIRIKIKIPKNIFGQQQGYSLEDLAKELNATNSDFRASLRFKSSDGCWNINREVDSEQLEIVDYCGWINITIHYEIGATVNNETREEICNLCEIGYSLCFSPVKLKTLYGTCHSGVNEVAEFSSETCLEIENVEAQRQVTLGNGTIITGPENFLCVNVVDESGATTSASFDKFSKTLTITADLINFVDLSGVNITDFTFTGDAESLTAGRTDTDYVPKP